ncbi:hypothetical protein [Nocardioides currus]|uniref:Uncharacterized protein n=1 Tax=Nocardioides currus TaxID=2133958 RepID=A0A2R7Z066_9ACTN|nr:hypothetical protein [Nocardioides currus]PUA82010.1 hypothetical protein C7S10_08215 [Nocardioides currus]
MRGWLVRVGALALLVVGGQVVLSLLDFDPRLRDWALMATAIVAILWLAYDTTGVGVADWDDPIAPYARPDAADESVHHRVLSSHLSARDPGPALRHLLLDLARGRDPNLRDPELRTLADQPLRRLSPTDIDRYLTRIETPRDDE